MTFATPSPGLIVCATDFSDGARDAAHRAALVACDAQIDQVVLVHVMGTALPPEFHERAIRGAQTALAALIDEIQSVHAVRMQPRLEEGSLLERLGAAARAGSLLAVGARGLHPFSDFALGSSAERLVRTARGPILVVKRPPQGAYRRVLVGVDFSPSSRAAARLAAALAPDARLELVHAYEVEFESTLRFADVPEETVQAYRDAARASVEQPMQALVSELALPAERLSSRLGRGYAPSVLEEARRRSDAELVVLGKHGKSALEELLLGSVTLHALQATRCDLLIVGGA